MASKKIQRGAAGNKDALAPANLPYQMFLLVQQMTRRFQAVLDPYGLTPLHWGILCCLWEEDRLRTSEIARRLEQLGGTVTVGLDVMQREGLIERRPDESDRRVSRISLTAKGRALQKVLKPQAGALIDSIFAVFGRDEYLFFEKQIGDLRRHNAVAVRDHRPDLAGGSNGQGEKVVKIE